MGSIEDDVECMRTPAAEASKSPGSEGMAQDPGPGRQGRCGLKSKPGVRVSGLQVHASSAAAALWPRANGSSQWGDSPSLCLARLVDSRSVAPFEYT